MAVLCFAKAGITAQKLRYLDVLLIAPWTIGVGPGTLRSVWRDEVSPKMPARTARTAVAIANDLFENVTDVIRDAARIPPDRVLRPEDIRAASQYGIEELFENGD